MSFNQQLSPEEDTCFLLNRIKNGRVNLDGDSYLQSVEGPYPLFSESKRGNISYKAQALKSILTPNMLQEQFFSQSNMNTLQTQIRDRTYSLTGYRIGTQSYTQLEIIMRSIYLQFAKNLNDSFESQVTELNRRVLKYAIPNVVSNLKQHIGYVHDVEHNPIPMQHPEYISNTGLKGL